LNQLPPGERSAHIRRASKVPRDCLVTALLPPAVGGTEVLVWRLFAGTQDLAVVSGTVPARDPKGDDVYTRLVAPTLALRYPRLRGYRYGLSPLLGAYATAWLAAALPRVIRFLKSHDIRHVVSIPHNGPFALLGLLAARHLGIAHTLYVLDAWEESGAGPIELKFVKWGLRIASRMPRSRLAAVSPALAAHYRDRFAFRECFWVPNPAPLAAELSVSDVNVTPLPTAVFTGGVKPFNVDAIRSLVRAVRHCSVVKNLIITGPSYRFSETLAATGELHDRVEFRMASRQEVAVIQRAAAVLLIATNVDDASVTARGYLPGRLPEYVAADRPILCVGPEDSEATRAVRHWQLGLTTASQDEHRLAAMLDDAARTGVNRKPGPPDSPRAAFLELFSRDEARRRLLAKPAHALTPSAAALTASFEAAIISH
jgi:hypothetical protein